MALPTNTRQSPSYLGLATVGLAGVLALADRQVIGILLPGIKASFGLSDALLGLLAGPAFAVFYSLMAVPLALLADRFGRRRIVAVSLAVFSVASIFCGAAGTFSQVIVGRIGIAVGQSGITPSINALVPDLAPDRLRASVLSIYNACLNFGFPLALVGGGWATTEFGWRAAFIVFGVPGLLVLLILLKVVPEPRPAAKPMRASWRDIVAMFSLLWSLPAFRYISFGIALASFGTSAGTAFTASFLVRSHHMVLTNAASTLALLVAIFGFAGTAAGGVLADWLGSADARLRMHISAGGMFLPLPFTAIFYLAGDLRVALVAAAVPIFFNAIYVGPAYAAVQDLVPRDKAAQAMAVLLIVPSIVGPGLGPQVVGLISDLLWERFGDDSLRYALLTSIAPSAIAGCCFWIAGRSGKGDRRMVSAQGGGARG